MIGINGLAHRVWDIADQIENVSVNLRLNEIAVELKGIYHALNHLKKDRYTTTDQDVDLIINWLMEGNENG